MTAMQQQVMPLYFDSSLVLALANAIQYQAATLASWGWAAAPWPAPTPEGGAAPLPVRCGCGAWCWPLAPLGRAGDGSSATGAGAGALFPDVIGETRGGDIGAEARARGSEELLYQLQATEVVGGDVVSPRLGERPCGAIEAADSSTESADPRGTTGPPGTARPVSQAAGAGVPLVASAERANDCVRVPLETWGSGGSDRKNQG